MSNESRPDLSLFLDILRTLENIGAPYMIIGAFAALQYGITRLTYDIDIVVDLSEEHIEALAATYPPPRYYADPIQMRDSIRMGIMFNIIDSSRGEKADLVPLTMASRYYQAFQHRIRQTIDVADTEPFEAWCARPQDVIVGKLMAWAEGRSRKHETDIAAAAAMHVVHDKTLNLEKYRKFIDQAAAEGARLLVLPEASLQGFLFNLDHCFDPVESEYHWRNAEPVPGPSTDLIARWAAEKEMYIIFGLMELSEHPATPLLHNSSVLVGPDGYIGTYRKVHQPSEELGRYQPGRDWPVFPTALGRIGMMICYDQCFPEAARELTLRGAEIIAVPNAWPKSDQASDDRYDFYGRSRAAENARWLLQANQAGPSDRGEFEYLGCSRIIDPTGMVVAHTTAGEEGLAIAEIEPAALDPTRARSGWYIQQRVPVYSKTWKTWRRSGGQRAAAPHGRPSHRPTSKAARGSANAWKPRASNSARTAPATSRRSFGRTTPTHPR